MNAALFVGQSAANMRLPFYHVLGIYPSPATRFKKGRRQKEEEERSFTSIKMLHTHTCSEQSLRILMWNASYVQNHSIKPDRKTRSEKNLEVCISTSLLDANRSLPDIKFGFKFV